MLETPYKGPFEIKTCWTNGTVTLKCGPIQIRYNIRRINPYKPDINVEHINHKNVCDNVKIRLPVIWFCIILNLENTVYNHISTETLIWINLGRGREKFNGDVILFT